MGVAEDLVAYQLVSVTGYDRQILRCDVHKYAVHHLAVFIVAGSYDGRGKGLAQERRR